MNDIWTYDEKWRGWRYVLRHNGITYRTAALTARDNKMAEMDLRDAASGRVERLRAALVKTGENEYTLPAGA